MGEPLTPGQAACVYDRIGRLQDWQRVYEGPAIEQVVRWGEFSEARSVYELGPGTGALAERLLRYQLPAEATYRGIDVSPTMVRLARERVHPWAERARIDQVDGSLPLPGHDGAYDRFLAVYVFDLLSTEYAQAVLSEAARLVSPRGLLALVSLTEGRSSPARAVTWGWRRLWGVDPRIVGGCRPVRLGGMLEERGWTVRHRAVVQVWGLASEVIVAAPAGR